MVTSLAVHMPLTGQHSSSDMPASPLAAAAAEHSLWSSAKRKALSNSVRFSGGGALKLHGLQAAMEHSPSGTDGCNIGEETQRSDAASSCVGASVPHQAAALTARSRRSHAGHGHAARQTTVSFALPSQDSCAHSMGEGHDDHDDAAASAAVVHGALSSRSRATSQAGASAGTDGGALQPWSSPVTPGRQQQQQPEASCSSIGSSTVTACSDEAQDLSEYLNELKAKQVNVCGDYCIMTITLLFDHSLSSVWLVP